jgi:hypothetical protein
MQDGTRTPASQHVTARVVVGMTEIEYVRWRFSHMHVDAPGEAVREDWARRQVARDGRPWDTHMAKFSGAVVQR